MNAKTASLLLVLPLFFLAVPLLTGCRADQAQIEEVDPGEDALLLQDATDLEPTGPGEGEDAAPGVEEPPVEEVPGDLPPKVSSYYWPWVSHGHLALSSGEVVLGPDLFESDLGFIGEFAAGSSYSGRLYWLVEETDVFALEWVTLTFDVEYYDQNEWVGRHNFDFKIDNLSPDTGPAANRLQQFTVDLAEARGGFEVRVTRVLLGKDQEGNFMPDPFDFVAIDIEMSPAMNE